MPPDEAKSRGVIELGKDNSREAVCLVFEKVNTGGVALNVFELITATYAADGFNLRTDWYGDKSNKIIGRREVLAAEGAKDFYYKQTIQQIDRDEAKIDFHHIFPKKWCEANKIPARRANAVMNKTPISAKANRSIGGKAPSAYLKDIQENKKVALKPAEMNEILGTHLIDSEKLRIDDFDAFYDSRKVALLAAIERAMGKKLLPAATAIDSVEDEEDEEDALEATA